MERRKQSEYHKIFVIKKKKEKRKQNKKRNVLMGCMTLTTVFAKIEFG